MVSVLLSLFVALQKVFIAGWVERIQRTAGEEGNNSSREDKLELSGVESGIVP